MKTYVVNKDGSGCVREVSMPVYNEHEALVKMIACGICGTDVKLHHRTFKKFPESRYPLMMGHEGVGEVIAVGAKVKGYKVGDRVLLPFVDADDIEEDLDSAWGAMSEYGIVCDAKSFPEGEAPDHALAQQVLDPDIDPVDGSMIVTFREVLSCIRYLGITPEHSVAVFGCGPVGLTYIKLLSLLGVKDLIACDVMEDKLQQAKEAGAALTIVNKETPVMQKAVRERFPDGLDYVFDAAGFPAVVNQGLTILKDRGKMVCYGVPESGTITLDFNDAEYNFQVIYQQFPKKPEEGAAHEQIMAWIRSGELRLKDFISDYYPFGEVEKAYQDLLNRKIRKKGIVTFG